MSEHPPERTPPLFQGEYEQAIAERDERIAQLEAGLEGLLDTAIWLTGLGPIDAPAWPEMRKRLDNARALLAETEGGVTTYISSIG